MKRFGYGVLMLLPLLFSNATSFFDASLRNRPKLLVWIATLVTAILASSCSTEIRELDAVSQSDGTTQSLGLMVPTKQIYTVVKDPESAFSIIGRNYDASVNGRKGGSSGSSLSAELAANIQRLADPLDQVNTQALGGYKAALFGLNSNPTSLSNQKEFWETVRQINKNASEIRQSQQYYTAWVTLRNGNISVYGPAGSMTTVQFAPVGHRVDPQDSNGVDQPRSPWFDTKIDLRENEEVYIHASGDVCCALQHLVQDDAVHRLPTFGWEGPEGVARFEPRAIDGIRLSHSLLPPGGEIRYGALIAKIVPISDRDKLSPDLSDSNAKLVGSANFKSEDGVRTPIPGRKLVAKTSGRLYLSVNEPMLGISDAGESQLKQSEELYAPNPFVVPNPLPKVASTNPSVSWIDDPNLDEKKLEFAKSKQTEVRQKPVYYAIEYYLSKILEREARSGAILNVVDGTPFTDADIKNAAEIGTTKDSSKDDALKKGIFSEYKVTHHQWDDIVREKNWTAWFNDNVGEFYVTVERPSDLYPNLSVLQYPKTLNP